MVETIVQTEVSLLKKHIIAQGFPHTLAITNLNSHVSVLNFHAAPPQVVGPNRKHERVLAFDETGGSDRSDWKYRSDGWNWLIAGGAVYDHLDFSFTTDRPDGSAVPLPEGTPGGGGPALRRQLRILKEFIESFDFVSMSPQDGVVSNLRITEKMGSSKSVPVPTVRVLAAPGSAYAVYVHGDSKAEFDLDLPANEYVAEWVNPRSGATEKAQRFRHGGGPRGMVSPGYSQDMALRVKRAGQGAHSKEQ